MSEIKRMFIPYGHKDELLSLLEKEGYKNTKLQFQKYVCIISRLIYYRTYLPERYEKKGVSINMKVLAAFISERDSNTKRIIDNLIKWEYIILNSNYYAGQRSRTYKLHPRFDDCRYAMISFHSTEGKLIRKMLNNGHDKSQSLLEQQLNILRNHITISNVGLSFFRKKYNNVYMDSIIDMYRSDDLSTSTNELLEYIPIEKEDMGLFSFLVGNFWTNRKDPQSRLYTNLCTLKREHRQYLLIDGKPLLSTDLVNSQLVFAIPVIENHLKENKERFDLTMAVDLVLYRDLAENGNSYESVAAFAGQYLEFNDRKKFKQRFYRDIFFSKSSNKRSRVKDAFNMLFPTFAEAMADIKRPVHGMFAVLCQRYEAYIMIDRVLNQLMEKGILALSLHDSIIVNNEADLQIAEELIRTEIQANYNVRISFKREIPGKAIIRSPQQAIDELSTRLKEHNPNFNESKWKKRQLKQIKQ